MIYITVVFTFESNDDVGIRYCEVAVLSAVVVAMVCVSVRTSGTMLEESDVDAILKISKILLFES